MSPQTFFAELWADYIKLAPQAGRIQALFQADNPVLENDHVAFRTLDQYPIALRDLEPQLLGLGYRRFQAYNFPDKHLRAWSYTAPRPELPRIFFSELLCDQLSREAHAILLSLCADIDSTRCRSLSVFHAGRLWRAPSWEDYGLLAEESEYAAWVAAHGLHANHFTLSVNALQEPRTLEAVVARVEAAGFALNRDGGVIKGSPAELLEQAATLADRHSVMFRDGHFHDIPSCYYEFARRYPQPNGELYQGFVAASAARIFSSTDQPS